MSCTRAQILSFLHEYLHVSAVSDVCPNGLQVEGSQKVSKVLTAVSANLELFKYAKKVGAEMVIVHHGLLWNDEHLTVTGNLATRLKFLLENEINLVAYHLPLDMHAVVGNNVLIAKKLGLKNLQPFGEYHGQKIGFKGELKGDLLGIKLKVEKLFGVKAITIDGAGAGQSASARKGECHSPEIRTIGIVSGGGMFALDEAAREVDLFIRGEVHEPTPAFCRETRLSYLSFGHYNSEKLGVQSVGELLTKKFKGLKCEFWEDIGG